jgi:hypothetical protein
MVQCKKTCIDLDKIGAVLKEHFTEVRKNPLERQVLVTFRSGKDERLLIVKLRPIPSIPYPSEGMTLGEKEEWEIVHPIIDNDIITLYMYTNNKTKRTRHEKKFFKTLKGLQMYAESIRRDLNIEGTKSRYEVHKISNDVFQVCDNVDGKCFRVNEEEAKKYM